MYRKREVETMPSSEAQKQAAIRYASKNYKRVPLDIRKEDYTVIKDVAERIGESVNGFIKKAISERLERVCGDTARLEELNFSMEEK